MKRHFKDGCGRGKAVTDNVYAVTCLICKSSESYVKAKEAADKAKHEAFLAQVPRVMGEPWKEGNIVCRSCGNETFRIGDRTCYGHYANFHCAACGNIESRLTETGMSA